MITTLIFDFGGVILKHSPKLMEEILSEMFPDHANTEEIWEEYKRSIMSGEKTSDDFLLELKKRTNSELEVTDLKQKWKSFYEKRVDEVDWELLDFIEKLKQNYKVYLFTDTIDVHDEYNRTRNIYDKFHHAYKSFEEGVAKAQGKIAYEHILEKINEKPQSCLFIDDLEFNILTAKEVGMEGIIYKNMEQLKEELKRFGIEV